MLITKFVDVSKRAEFHPKVDEALKKLVASGRVAPDGSNIVSISHSSAVGFAPNQSVVSFSAMIVYTTVQNEQQQ